VHILKHSTSNISTDRADVPKQCSSGAKTSTHIKTLT